MRMLSRSLLVVLSLGCLLGLALTGVSASLLLDIITPVDQTPGTAYAPVVEADASGRVMAVYMAQGQDDVWRLYGLVRQGSGWQSTVVPLPEPKATPSTLRPRSLVGGPRANEFHLLGSSPSNLYYWHYFNGSWSQPETVRTTSLSDPARTITLDEIGRAHV